MQEEMKEEQITDKEYVSSEDSTVADWNLSQTELSLEGMDNPFKDRWKHIEKTYYGKS
jgi:hypothetical protein